MTVQASCKVSTEEPGSQQKAFGNRTVPLREALELSPSCARDTVFWAAHCLSGRCLSSQGGGTTKELQVTYSVAYQLSQLTKL